VFQQDCLFLECPLLAPGLSDRQEMNDGRRYDSVNPQAGSLLTPTSLMRSPRNHPDYDQDLNLRPRNNQYHNQDVLAVAPESRSQSRSSSRDYISSRDPVSQPIAGATAGLVSAQAALQKSIAEMSQSQALIQHMLQISEDIPSEQSLQKFIKQQIDNLKSSLVSELRDSRAELSASLGEALATFNIWKDLTLQEELLARFREEFAAISRHKDQTSKEELLHSLRQELAAANISRQTSGNNVHKQETSSSEEQCGDIDGKEQCGDIDGIPASRVAMGSQGISNGVHGTANDAELKAADKKWEALWADMAEAVADTDVATNAYAQALRSQTAETTSIWHDFEELVGFKGWILHRQIPDNALARITEQPAFSIFQNMLILSNTGFMGIEADLKIKSALGDKAGPPDWLQTVNTAFTLIFVVELLFRMIALRTWFWVAPGEWGWNFFDLVLVATSVVTEVLIGGINLSFIRLFRILRAVRAVRLIRVLRFFRELRKMLFAILASLRSLVWCFVFLGMTMYMFTILFLQGIVPAIVDMPDPSKRDRAFRLTKMYFDSVPGAMFSLLAAVTGGVDWVAVKEPLDFAGPLYTAAFVLYVLFVTVGVMNVLTGVFLASSDEYVDRNTIVQNEQVRVDNFVAQMLELFGEVDKQHTGEIDWPRFRQAMKDPLVQSYLSAHDLEPTHGRMIFDLLDEKGIGKVNIFDWVMGMVRLKGEAKAVDVRIIQRQISMIPKMIKYQFQAEAVHVGEV